MGVNGEHCSGYFVLLLTRSGILKAGDRILKINHSDMTRASQMEALTRLKASDDVCELEIEYDVTVHGKYLFFRGLLLHCLISGFRLCRFSI